MPQLQLFGSTAAYGSPDLSPFVAKVEVYCRLFDIPFEKKLGDPRKAPKGKVPWIDDGGTIVADSTAILRHLAKTRKDPDADATPRERATARALQSMIEEHLYFVVMYLRWSEPRGWAAHEPVFKKFLVEGAGVPSLLGGLVMGRIRKKTSEALATQGVGRHAAEEIDATGAELVRAFADHLGDAPYLFGDAPRTIDAVAYAFFSGIRGFPVDGATRRAVTGDARLTAYLDRIAARVSA